VTARARVLIGFAEALPAPEAVFSLLAAGCEVRAFARPGGGAMLRGLPIGAPVEIPAPEANAQAAVDGLKAAIEAVRPDALLALDDPALWLAGAAFGGGREGVAMAHATGEQAAVALDKAAQIEAARAAGLATPPTLVARRPEDLRGLDEAGVGFPAILKPAEAVGLRDGRLVKGGAEYLLSAEDAARAAATPGGSYPALVQPLIAGAGEGVFGFALDDGVVAWSGHRRLRMMNPHGSGASACAVNPPDAATREAVAAMAAAIGWRGPFMVEFLRDEAGTLWFMELNGRMWGSMALARRNGLEYPAWAVARALDPAFCPEPGAGAGRKEVRHLGRELLHVMHVARGPRGGFPRAGWPGLWPAAQAALRPGRGAGFYNYDPAYPRFFLHDAWRTVRAALGRRR
jgi:hypothetical protein